MSRLAAAFLFCAGLVHAILGASAIAGAARLEANVQEIETSAVGGNLYLALGTIGLIMASVALLEFVATGTPVHTRRKRAHARPDSRLPRDGSRLLDPPDLPLGLGCDGGAALQLGLPLDVPGYRKA